MKKLNLMRSGPTLVDGLPHLHSGPAVKLQLKLRNETIKVLTSLRFVHGGAPDDTETVICTLGRACDHPSDLCITKDCTGHGC